MIIFDEKKHAEQIIAYGYSNDEYVNRDSIILVKYWKYKGFDKHKIEDKLRDALDAYKELYNRNILDNRVKRAMSIGMRYDLLTGITVEILDTEIKLINELKTDQQRRLMFIMLIVWKFWGMKDFRAANKDLIGLTKVKMNNDTFWNNIHQLTKSGLLSMKQFKEKDYYVIDIEQTGKPMLKINDYRDLVYYYFAANEPDRYGKCEKCGKIIEITSNRKMYCRSCWRERERALRKEINRKYYKKRD